MVDPRWVWPTESDKAEVAATGQRMRWSLWAARYERFRQAGPGRSLLALYNAERAEKGQPPAKRVPGAWDEVAQTWDWRARAAAWDVEQLLAHRREQEAEAQKLQLKARQQRRLLMEAGYTLIVNAMNHIKDDVNETQAVKIIAAMSKFLEHSRLEYGETRESLTTALQLMTAGLPDEDHRGRVVRELGIIKRAALADGDLKLVMDVIRAERDLLGLDAPKATRSEVSGPGGSAIQTLASEVHLYLPENGREAHGPGD